MSATILTSAKFREPNARRIQRQPWQLPDGAGIFLAVLVSIAVFWLPLLLWRWLA